MFGFAASHCAFVSAERWIGQFLCSCLGLPPRIAHLSQLNGGYFPGKGYHECRLQADTNGDGNADSDPVVLEEGQTYEFMVGVRAREYFLGNYSFDMWFSLTGYMHLEITVDGKSLSQFTGVLPQRCTLTSCFNPRLPLEFEAIGMRQG